MIGNVGAIGMSNTPTVVAGRYRLLRQLGAGGMGKVWLAHDEMLDRHVAIKQVVLPPGLSLDEAQEARSRTLREARTAAQLNHSSVVQIYDVVHTEAQPWIVMEYVPSRSLHEVINEDGPLEPLPAARIGLAVLDALEAAHQAGILHRDVKPGNVLLAQDGRVVLTDFGLATFDGGESALTLPGLVFGSVRFVAPERARHGTSSPETDMWALGATLYAAVEGRSPYARDTAMETLAALATALPDPPRHAGPLKPVLRGLLRRNPRHRLTVDETRRLLRHVVGGERRRWLGRRRAPVLLTQPGKSPTIVLNHGNRPAVPAEPPKPARHRPRLVVLAAGGAAVAVAAVSLMVAATASPDHRTAEPPPASASAQVDSLLGSPVCPTANRTELRPASRQPNWNALVAGWVWYRDPTGYRIAVPGGWTAYTGPGGMCFRDTGDNRWLGVSQWAGAGDPVAHVRSRAQELHPQGYQEVRVAPVPYYKGGADWEFQFDAPIRGRMHGVVRDFVVAPGLGYTISWCTTEFDWSVNLDNFRLVMASFGLPG
jgi:eukaryotic-like serine/threonine-protein kinase